MSSNQCNERAGTAPASTTGAAESSNGGGGTSSGSGGDGVEGDEQEESSSSSHMEKSSLEDVLSTFREQWQRELESSPRRDAKVLGSSEQDTVGDPGESSSIENEAKSLFLKGVEHEQSGKLYEAIQFYRRAVQLVPDIEFRLYDTTSKLKSRERERHDSEGSADGSEAENEREPDTLSEDEDESESDLLTRLQKFFTRTRCVCIPQQEQQGTHVSALPMEIMLYILKWVVSSDLDMRSLEMCSRVCRGFYLCSRDPEIWRLACIRVWGVNCGDLSKYDSWRQMFIERPRLHFNGCYISKTTYLRHGENSFQDQFYRPWHLVEYYRYLRFFPEGRVLMLTTPDDPVSCVGQLKYRTPRNTGVLVGHYRLQDFRVVLVLKRQETPAKMAVNNRFRNRRRENIQDMGEQTFHMVLQIHSYRNRMNSQLEWEHYSVKTKYRNGVESTAAFDLPGNRYPPFWFSRVKSYTAESETPLQ